LSFGCRLTVGSDPSCDIVLVDPGVKSLELSVELSPEGWKIERFDAKGKPTASKILPWGRPENAGGVVITVVATSEPWAFVPIEQVTSKKSASAEKTKSSTNDMQPNEATEDQNAALRPKSRRKLTQRLAISAAVIFGFATFSISRAVSTPESQSKAQTLSLGGQADVESSMERLAVANLPAKGNAAAWSNDRQPNTPTKPGVVETNPAKLRAMLVQKLRDTYLEEKLEINLTDREWNFHGSLDDEEAERFNRIVSGFIKEHNVKILLKADVTDSGDMLPFRIQQFNGGAMASIVTDDGHRLYIGDAHMGYTLQKIDGRRIVFAGKRKVEVLW
jgi:type III secretion protein D